MAGGAAVDRDAAIAKAVGEAVERYCAAIYVLSELPLSSYGAAPFRCANPGGFALYSREQYDQPDFMFLPFGETTPIRWTQATTLPGGELCHVPAAMAYVPYTYFTQSGDTPIFQPISTGLASHSGWAAASISAICEVIERDAFTIVWQSRMAAPHIRRESLWPETRQAIDRFETPQRAVTLLDITLDIAIPTILAVQISSNTSSPAISVAAATSANPQLAALKAVEELAHTYCYSAELMRTVPETNWPKHADDVLRQDHHLLYWADHRHSDQIAFLLENPAVVDLPQRTPLGSGDPDRQLAALSQVIGSAGFEIFLADLTTPDISDLGLNVVRAIIPGLHPLQIGHRYRALGGERLWQVPQRLGYRGIGRSHGDNSLPHPYP
jgi:ribosomal protein S12 methylthiotransferase accessory factor